MQLINSSTKAFLNEFCVVIGDYRHQPHINMPKLQANRCSNTRAPLEKLKCDQMFPVKDADLCWESFFSTVAGPNTNPCVYSL